MMSETMTKLTTEEVSRINSQVVPGLWQGSAPGLLDGSSDTCAFHVVEGPDWQTGSLLGHTSRLQSYTCGTPAGAAIYKALDHNTGGRTFSQIHVGNYHHPITDEIVASVWRYYR